MSRTTDGIATFIDSHTTAAAPVLVETLESGALRCLACGNRCVIQDGNRGICCMRANRGGELRVPRGYVAGLQVDPIEKKPFFHAYPGRDALSFGMVGCNLHCSFCQNWVSSQAMKDDLATALPREISSDRIVDAAVREGAPVMVSTYNEPLITSEWAVEVFDKARAKGIKCGYVSNGNATPEVISYLRPHMELYKVDLKTFNDDNYKALGCRLENVLDTIVTLKAQDFWVEIVTLVVTGFNDSPGELRQIADFIAGVSVDIPWHVTAFHPDYQMTDRERTTAAQLSAACDAGKAAGLRYVYQGNMHSGERENTLCHGCGKTLIERQGFYVLSNRMRGDACPDCGQTIPGVWEAEPPRRSAVHWA